MSNNLERFFEHYQQSLLTREENYVIISSLNSRKENSMTSIEKIKRERHSDTRDKIYAYLCGTKAHPSAEMIYNDLKPELPKLSLKTVYTNLRFFEDHGQVIHVANVNGIERYDANCEDHVHFVCNECGQVIDLMEANVLKAKKACNLAKDAKITSFQIVIHGTCDACSDKSK